MAELPSIVHNSTTVAGTASISLITHDDDQVQLNGADVFIFDANGAESIAAPVVASPVKIVAGGNNVTVLAES